MPNYSKPTSAGFPKVLQPTRMLELKGVKYNVMGIMGHFFTADTIMFQVFFCNLEGDTGDRIGVVLTLQEMLDYDVNVLQNYSKYPPILSSEQVEAELKAIELLH